MPPAASLGGTASGAATATATSGGGGGIPPLDPARLKPPPAPPDDFPVLKLLQQGNVFGDGRGNKNDEVPLLVPLLNGAITNIYFDESHGEPQEALIERYLTLMGVAPPALLLPPPSSTAGPPSNPSTAAAAAAIGDGGTAATDGNGGPGGQRLAPEPARTYPGARPAPASMATAATNADISAVQPAESGQGQVQGQAQGSSETDDQDDDDLLLSVQRPRRQPPPPGPPGVTPALTGLGLDRPSLSRRGIPEALIGALHRGMAANAAAFFRTCMAEQRRLLALTHGSGPSVPLADRLLAFITGMEEQLKDGSAVPDLVDLRKLRDNQALLDAVSPPPAGPTVPFYHELLYKRQQQQQQQQQQEQEQSPLPSEDGLAPTPTPPDEETPLLEELLDLDKVTALATAGNVPGLRALLRKLVAAADYTRTSLLGRLKAEGERAQREGVRATEARMAAARLREQLAARNAALAERGAELEAACRRATAAEEALVTEQSIVAGLRGQLRQLTADYETQHRQLRAGLEAHLTRPTSAKLLLGGVALLSGKNPGAQAGSGGQSADEAGLHALGAQLAAARAELALSEMGGQQERAAARQLRVMLDTARSTLDLHVGRAVAAEVEVERLGRLVTASKDLASASTGGMAMLEQQLAQEKAAHRRTMERLQETGWKVEQARTAVVDVRARAAHHLRKLQTALADVNLRAVSAERQLTDATIELRHTRSDLEGATNSIAALRDRTQQLEADMAVLRQDAITARLDAKEVTERLRDTETTLRTAEARMSQMQQKIMDDADTVLEGRKASSRLAVLEKEHEDLLASHQELQGTHALLKEHHLALQNDMAEARIKISDLEVKEARLVELTAAHEELQAAKARLDLQYAGVLKAKSLLSSELAGLKRHADVLAEQVQEYRRLADGARIALEEEKEALRHTREELSMTAAKRDELENKCTNLSSTLEGMDVRVKAAETEMQRCRRVAELAGHQRAEAFAMRDAMMKVRISLTCEVKEYLSAVEGQVRQMGKRLQELQTVLTVVQSRLLDMDPSTLDGTTAELPKLPYEEAQKMISSLFEMVAHGSQILEAHAGIRKALVERIDQLEEGIKDRLATATDYWRQVLALSRGTPRSMIQMVEHMTGQACREMDLDPVNPMSRMVPLGVLEEAGIQLNTQFERVGMLRDRADESKARSDAANKLLEHERQVSSARAAEYQSLVTTLSREVNRLKRRVGSLAANNHMQQRATADMQRMLNDAEWKVLKAQEREALLGVKYMVPQGRETKAVQTVFSDLYMMMGPVSPAITIISSAPAAAAAATARQQQQQQLLQGRLVVSPDPAAPADGGEFFGGSGCGVEEGMEYGGGSAEAPGSPASLPPLSALNSPCIASAAGGGGAGGATWSGNGSARNPQHASMALHRAQSNLSRVGSALPHAPSPLRCTSPDLPNAGPDGGSGGGGDGCGGGGGGLRSAFAAAAAAAAGGSAMDVPLGRSPSTSANGGVVQGRVPPQRRRHPDEVPRRSAGSALSPVASVNSLHSANSVLLDTAMGINGGGGAGAAAAAAGAHGGASISGGGIADEERSYTSDVNVGTGGGGGGEEDEYGPPSPLMSPPMVLRTPSTSATAANAAAFTVANSRVGSTSMHHHRQQQQHPTRPATAGPPSSPWVSVLPPGSPAGNQPHHLHHHHAVRLSGAVLHSSRPASPVVVAPVAAAAPPTPSGIPHGWQHTPWDWLPDATTLARGGAVQLYSRQALLEIIADIHYTKGLHDQVAAAASFPATSMQQYIGAYFEARHGPRGSNPPSAELALAQLLTSLEVHSALYEVMLFARVAGLQGWTGKVGKRNGSNNNADSRPATAQSHKMTAGTAGGFSRPRTPRDANVSPYASGGLSPSRPGTAASVAAVARNSRTMSARNAVAAPPVMLGLVPSSRPSTAASPPLAPCGAGNGTVAIDVSDLALPPNGGETVMRLRTGVSPTISVNGSGGSGAGGAVAAPPSYVPVGFSSINPNPASHPLYPSRRAVSSGTLNGAPASPQYTISQQQQLQQQLQPPRPQLRVRPELLISEQLSGLLGRLGEVSGMEALSQFISTGRLLGKLRQADLGQPLQDELHPELHFTVRKVCNGLGISEAPELLVRQTLPYGADVMLLQLPYVATGSLAVLAQGDVDKQPVPTPAAAPSAAAGGWRRRGLLLLTPALVSAVETAALHELEGPMVGDEVRALLGATLAPLAMPGGLGWRLEVQPTSGTSSSGGGGGGANGNGGVGSGSAAAPASPPSHSTAASPTLLSAAEVMTAVNVTALKGRSVPSVLPSQLQFKWERLLSHLRTVAAAVTVGADRGALLATQNVAAAVRAVFRAAAGLGLQEGANLGGGEELLLQAQTMPLSDDLMMNMAALPQHDVAAEGGESRRNYALARVAVLMRWAEAPEYRQLLRSAVM